MTGRHGIRIVAGFGRSGTTWVQDVLAESNRLRAVFEPLHPIVFDAAGIPVPAYHEADDEDPALKVYLERCLYGEFHSLWMDYRVNRGKLLPRGRNVLSPRSWRAALAQDKLAMHQFRRYRRQRQHEERIVKFVRASLLLSWLKRQFDARVVYLVRHPVAVVVSRMRATASWDPGATLNRYRHDSRLLATLQDDTRTLLDTTLNRVEMHALEWCIDVRSALRQAKASDIPVFCYEELIENGRPEWQRLLAALDLGTMPDDELIRTPSQQAWGASARSGERARRYDAWMTGTPAETLDSVRRILDATSMDLYLTSSALPVRNPLETG